MVVGAADATYNEREAPGVEGAAGAIVDVVGLGPRFDNTEQVPETVAHLLQDQSH